MTTTKRRRKCPKHGLHRNAIVRSWREGYCLRAIGRMYAVSPSEVARIVTASGVCWSHVAVRERIERNTGEPRT